MERVKRKQKQNMEWKIIMKNTSKRLLLGASAVIALTLAGCTATNETDTDVDTDETEQVQEVQPLHIAKPDIVDIEDDVVDTAQLQANLDSINEGERLPDYEPANEDERVLEPVEGFETNDEHYTAKDPKELHEGTHLVYVGRDTCPYCVLLRVNLDPVVEQLGLGLGYIDTDNEEHEQIMVEEFGLRSVPMIAVFHDGEVIAEFPQQNMYLDAGVNYQSLANGLGDLTNIYLTFKHDIEVSDEESAEDTAEESVVEETEEGSE